MSFSTWVQRWIYQLAHVGWGAYLTMALSQHMTVGNAALWILAAATVKEGIFDPLTEDGVARFSGFQDWLFWVIGIAIGILSFL